jgi:hypothetical protein
MVLGNHDEVDRCSSAWGDARTGLNYSSLGAKARFARSRAAELVSKPDSTSHLHTVV